VRFCSSVITPTLLSSPNSPRHPYHYVAFRSCSLCLQSLSRLLYAPRLTDHRHVPFHLPKRRSLAPPIGINLSFRFLRTIVALPPRSAKRVCLVHGKSRPARERLGQRQECWEHKKPVFSSSQPRSRWLGVRPPEYGRG
jgi:hypothetical protein